MITVLRQSNTGRAASARNFGAQHARGDILAFTDDDCRPTPQWLKKLAQSFHDVPAELVGGRTVNGLDNNLYSTTSQMIVDEAYAYFFRRKSDLRFFASNNMAVSAKLFHESGGFDPAFRTSEDRDLCDRWMRRGHSLVYASEAIVYHHHHLTLTAFCRQHFHYGRGAHRFYRMRAQRGRSRWKPDLQFYASVSPSCAVPTFVMEIALHGRFAGIVAGVKFSWLFVAAHLPRSFLSHTALTMKASVNSRHSLDSRKPRKRQD